MNPPKDDSLEQIECDVLAEYAGVAAENSSARVVIRRAMRKTFDAFEIRAQGRLVRAMLRWCEDPSLLTNEMFNGNEGNTSRHKKMLKAFKAFKVRLYGFSITIGGRRTFIVVDADPSKKQNKADPGILKRAKSRVDDLLDLLEKKES